MSKTSRTPTMGSTTQTERQPLTIQLQGAPSQESSILNIPSRSDYGSTIANTNAATSEPGTETAFSKLLSNWFKGRESEKKPLPSVANTAATIPTELTAPSSTKPEPTASDWGKYGPGRTLVNTPTRSCLKGTRPIERKSVIFNDYLSFSEPPDTMDHWKVIHPHELQAAAAKMAEKKLSKRDLQIMAYAQHRNWALPTSTATLEDVLGSSKSRYQITYDTGTTAGTIGLDLAGTDAKPSLAVMRIRDPNTGVIRYTRSGLALKWKILSEMTLDEADQEGRLLEYSKAWLDFSQHSKLICATKSELEAYRKSVDRVGEDGVRSMMYSVPHTETRAGKRDKKRLVWNDLDSVNLMLEKKYSEYNQKSTCVPDDTLDGSNLMTATTPGQRARELLAGPVNSSGTVNRMSEAARNPLI